MTVPGIPRSYRSGQLENDASEALDKCDYLGRKLQEAEARIRELEAELLKPAMLDGVAYVPEEKLKVAYQRIARAREILKEYLKETNYFYSGSKVRTPMEDRMAKALDALEGK